MSAPVITVENISKAFRIGAKEEVPDTLVGAMKGVMRAPWKNLRQLRNLNTYNVHDPDQTEQSQSNAEETLWALRDVSFEINQGDVIGIIGRNGAGKSTLLKVLSRITEPTSGRVTIRGRVSSLLEVGTGFHPELTGRENVYMNGTILGMTKREIDRKFDEIVDFSGVEKFLDTPTKRYSSGMQVRLAFAVAAHLEPEILIIDEVLAVGDAEFQKKCLGKMQDVAGSGRTVVFVSHNMGAVNALCGRCVYMEQGRLTQIGETSEIVDRYLQRGTSSNSSKQFSIGNELGDSRINLKSVNINKKHGCSGSVFQDTDDLILNIDYELLKPITGMRFNVHMLTSDGAAFSSTDCGVQKKEFHSPGSYTTKCHIPGGLLNRRRYIVAISCYIPPNDLLVPRTEIISFDIEGMGNQGPNNELNWPGAVCPKLVWRVEALTNKTDERV